MSKHTPGPWRVGVDEDDYLYSLHIYADDDDGEISITWCSCSQDGAQGGKDAPRLTAARANALLCAAAPDLLTALEPFTRLYQGSCDGRPLTPEHIERARKAYAKALGVEATKP